MDEHHRQLFRAANAFDQGTFVGEDRAIIDQTLGFLLQYAVTHFTAEEALMMEYGVPEFERHKRQHDKSMDDVLTMKSRASEGAFRASTEFLNFFKDWIINHILTEDRKYSPFLNERGIS
jgi:hemerythrin